MTPLVASGPSLSLRHRLASIEIACLAGLGGRARRLVSFFDIRMEVLITLWIGIMGFAGALKLGAALVPPRGFEGKCALLLPYLFVALAPVAGYRIAAGSFPRGLLSAQPTVRLAVVGKWRGLDIVEARQNPAYGPRGFMVSLLVGMLLNVPVRTIEFLLAVPAVGPQAPYWAQAIFHAMALDVIVMNFFYMVCFVMALRSVPLFPRMLLFAWLVDIMMQQTIAGQVMPVAGLPADVASSLLSLLHGNVVKVLVSMTLWLPYLLLSERVNVTYRHRCTV